MMSMGRLIEILEEIGYREYCFEREKSLPQEL